MIHWWGVQNAKMVGMELTATSHVQRVVYMIDVIKTLEIVQMDVKTGLWALTVKRLAKVIVQLATKQIHVSPA